MKWPVALVGVPLLALGGALAALAWVGSERAIHPRGGPAEYEPKDVGLEVEPVHFSSLDGTRLAGWFVPGQRSAAVILAHGYASRREEMLPHAAFLHEAGYPVLLFDFRYCGESEGSAVTLGALERLDLLGAVRYLRERPELAAAPVAVLGVSMGAASAILAAAQSEAIAAVVAECCYASIENVIAQSFRRFIHLPPFPAAPLSLWLSERRLGYRARDVRPVEAIARLGTRPLFLLHGLADDAISPANSLALHAAAPQASLWLIEGAPHARAYQTEPDGYRRRVLTFLEQALAQ